MDLIGWKNVMDETANENLKKSKDESKMAAPIPMTFLKKNIHIYTPL